jgi:hypothetical protein
MARQPEGSCGAREMLSRAERCLAGLHNPVASPCRVGGERQGQLWLGSRRARERPGKADEVGGDPGTTFQQQQVRDAMALFESTGRAAAGLLGEANHQPPAALFNGRDNAPASCHLRLAGARDYGHLTRR